MSFSHNFIVSTNSELFKLTASIQIIGKDILVVIYGGKAHIGAIAVAQPRPSSKDITKISSSSSVFTITGHKEDVFTKNISEVLAKRFNTMAIVTGGVHWDNISSEDIDKINENILYLQEIIVEKIGSIMAPKN